MTKVSQNDKNICDTYVLKKKINTAIKTIKEL